MVKKSASINIEEKDWAEWKIFVIRKYGTDRGMLSKALVDAIKFYMEHHDKKI